MCDSGSQGPCLHQGDSGEVGTEVPSSSDMLDVLTFHLGPGSVWPGFFRGTMCFCEAHSPLTFALTALISCPQSGHRPWPSESAHWVPTRVWTAAPGCLGDAERGVPQQQTPSGGSPHVLLAVLPPSLLQESGGRGFLQAGCWPLAGPRRWDRSPEMLGPRCTHKLQWEGLRGDYPPS